MIKTLLHAMHITYVDNPSFLEKQTENFRKFHKMATGLFTKEAIEIFEEIRKDRKKCLHSILIIEYYLAEIAYFALKKKTNSRKAREVIGQLNDVEHILNDDQRYIFYLYKSFFEQEKDLNLAIALLNQAMQIQESGFGFLQLSELHAQKYDFQSQIKFLAVCENLFLQEGNFRGLVFAKHYSGVVHFTIQKYQEAINQFHGTINLLDTAGKVDDYIIGFKYFAINNIAEVYYLQKKYNAMMRYCDRFITEQENRTDVYSVMPYLLLVRYSLQKADNELASHYLLQAEKRVDKVVNKEKEIEIGLIALFKYMLGHPGYMNDKGYWERLLELKKSATMNRSAYMMVLIDKDLIEYYKANRKYKEALLLTESLSIQK
jgi:tetratricopeptide (TPR) repeat protein